MSIITQYIQYKLPDGAATIACAPGVHAPGVANIALFDAARHIDADTVFVSGPGMTASALWAARSGAHVTGWTDNIAEAQAIAATFTRNRLKATLVTDNWSTPTVPYTATIAVRADFSILPPASCDLALILMPRGKQLQAELLQLSAALLRPGGRLVFVGAKNEGVKGVPKKAQALFGRAGIVVRKGGYHAGLAARPPGDYPLPDITFSEYTLMVDAIPTQLVNCAGTFAAGRLDDGAAALIAGMQITPGARVLDLGCGTGLVGLTALRRGAHVTFSDVSARAVASTRRTLAANGYPDAPVHLACGADSLPGPHFDIVITNPPFHKGHATDFEVAQLFVKQAARLVKPGGKVYLVANAFLPYPPWLTANFSTVITALKTPRFRVWEAVR